MSTLNESDIAIYLPNGDSGNLDQDQEYCEVEVDGRRKRIRFHDYAEIYKVAGLYESLFDKTLQCNSPNVVASLLQEAVEAEGEDTDELRVMDFGAGNGMVAEELARIGANTIVGVDLLEEAKDAAERDRPDLYEDYFVTDMTAPPQQDLQELEQHDFNCLTCVAALGFGDVPPEALANAFNLVSSPGWVAFNIRERFIETADESGFATLLKRMFEEGALVERARLRYPHRLSVGGDELHYVALVGEKKADVPADWLPA